MKKFNEGDVVYFISSSVFIKKVTVIRNTGGFCTIRFLDGNCGTSGTRVRESKLYRTEEVLNTSIVYFPTLINIFMNEFDAAKSNEYKHSNNLRRSKIG